MSRVRIAETTLPPPDLTLAEGLRQAIAEADDEERMLSTVTEESESIIRKDTIREDLADISYSARHEAGVSSNGAWKAPARPAAASGSTTENKSRPLQRFDPSAASKSTRSSSVSSNSLLSKVPSIPKLDVRESLRRASLSLPATPTLPRFDIARIGRNILKTLIYTAIALLAGTAIYLLGKGANQLRPHLHWPNLTWLNITWPKFDSSSSSPYPSPPVVSTNTANCLEHFESLESWLNSSFSILEKRHQASQQDQRLSLDDLYDRYRSDLDIRIQRASKATEACLSARESLGKEIDSVKSDITAHTSRIEKLERLVESVHGPDGRQHIKNWMSAHIGAVVIPSLTSLTASFGMGFWERLKYKFATSKENYPPIEALRPWTEAGQCWCGVGPFVQLGVQLPISIKPTLFRIEHVPAAGNIDLHSQPRELEIWGRLNSPDLASSIQQRLYDETGMAECAVQSPGMESHDWICLGSLVMQRGSGLASLPVLVDMEISRVVVRTKSNWGNEGYTCFYRVTLAGEAV